MTNKFRIERISMATSGGSVQYAFPSDLTVLAGGVGVGKSTLFELIKHGTGGDALLADVVDKNVTSVSLEIEVGARRFRLTRSTLSKESKRVRVVDLERQENLPDHYTDGYEPSISSLLLNAMDLPDDVKAAGTSGTKQGNRVTFNDVFKYMYVPQGEINDAIAGSGDSYYQPKRRAVFELLFDLTNAEILDLRSQINRVRGEWESADRESTVVLQFLADSNTPSRFDAQTALQDSVTRHDRADEQIRSIQAQTAPAIDRRTQTLRQLLGESEKALGDAQSSRLMLRQEQTDFERERTLLGRDIEQLDRIRSAGSTLASIEFAVCPRCMQDVRGRHVPEHSCRLCLQPDPVVEASADASTYEQNQLSEQIAEMDAQVRRVAQSINEVAEIIESREALIRDLTSQIQERTEERITPQLQAYADATAQKAEALAQQRELEKTLIQWDRADDLEQHASGLNKSITSLKGNLNVAESVLKSRRDEVFDEIDDELMSIVADVHIPGVSSARLDRASFLPLLNGRKFHDFAPPGGVRTATQVAYWVALMNVALRRRDTHFPGFLLMDSPRTSLNDDDELSAALYRRLVTMADAAEGRVQVIIADNELPAVYRRDYAQIDFDYDHPTVPTVPHPGLDAVVRIGDA